MSGVRKHFKLNFPAINYTAMFAEMENGTYTKTYLDPQGKITSELINPDEYLAALTYGLGKTFIRKPPK